MAAANNNLGVLRQRVEGLRNQTDVLAQRLIDELDEELSTLDKIGSIMGKIFSTLGEYAFIAGLAALVLTGIVSGIAPVALSFEIPTYLSLLGALFFSLGEIVKPAADLTLRHTVAL